MIFRRVLIAGLVGSAMLAGCNNADDKAPATPDAQGTFAEDISPLNGGVDQATIKGLKDALDTLQANTVILQGEAVTSKETLAALKSTIELLQSRVGQTEISVAALTELGPRIDKLDAGLKSLTDNFKTLDGRTAGIQADMDRLKPLREQFTALKDDYGNAIKLKLEAAALAPLLADIDLLKTGKADAGKLADLQVELDGLKEEAIRKLKGQNNAGLICVSSVTPNGGMPPSALITFD
jgi:chromosome segregation ATPase